MKVRNNQMAIASILSLFQINWEGTQFYVDFVWWRKPTQSHNFLLRNTAV